MAAIAGFGGRILVNGTVLRAYHWSVDYKVDDFDVTTFENVGVGQYISGLTDYDISFDAYFDTTDDPFIGPLFLTPGMVVEIVIRYQKNLTTQSWTFPTVLLTNVHNETGVRDVIRFTVTGKATDAVASDPIV